MDPSNSNGGKSAWNYALSGKIMLSAIVMLFTVVLLILFLHLYVRWHIIRRASHQARRRRRLVFSGDTPAAVASPGNRGLEPSILASLSVLLFSDLAGEEDESVECAVCLNEFEEGEKIRSLPDCAHRFHVDCIDMWFCSHSTCPLCRTPVKDPAIRVSGGLPTENPTDSNSDSSENELISSIRLEEVAGSSSADSGLQEVRIDVPETRSEVVSNGGGQEDRQVVRRDLPEQGGLKLPISRMVLIRWLLMRDPRIQRSNISESDTDLERGGEREFHLPNPSSSSSPATVMMNGGGPNR